MKHKDFKKKAKIVGYILTLKTLLPASKHKVVAMLKLIGNLNNRHQRIQKLNILINNGYIKEKKRILYASSLMNNFIETSVKSLHDYISKDRKRLIDKLKENLRRKEQD